MLSDFPWSFLSEKWAGYGEMQGIVWNAYTTLHISQSVVFLVARFKFTILFRDKQSNGSFMLTNEFIKIYRAD